MNNSTRKSFNFRRGGARVYECSSTEGDWIQVGEFEYGTQIPVRCVAFCESAGIARVYEEQQGA